MDVETQVYEEAAGGETTVGENTLQYDEVAYDNVDPTLLQGHDELQATQQYVDTKVPVASDDEESDDVYSDEEFEEERSDTGVMDTLSDPDNIFPSQRIDNSHNKKCNDDDVQICATQVIDVDENINGFDEDFDETQQVEEEMYAPEEVGNDIGTSGCTNSSVVLPPATPEVSNTSAENMGEGFVVNESDHIHVQLQDSRETSRRLEIEHLRSLLEEAKQEHRSESEQLLRSLEEQTSLANLNQKEIEAFKEEQSALQKRLTWRAKLCDDMKVELENVKSELSGNNMAVIQLKDELVALKEVADKYRRELEDTLSENGILKSKLEASRAEMSTLVVEKERLKSDEVTVRMLDEYKIASVETKEKLVALERAMEAMKSEKNANIESLLSQISNLTQGKENAEAKLAESAERILSLQEKLSNENANAEMLRLQLQKTTEELAITNKELKDSKVQQSVPSTLQAESSKESKKVNLSPSIIDNTESERGMRVSTRRKSALRDSDSRSSKGASGRKRKGPPIESKVHAPPSENVPDVRKLPPTKKLRGPILSGSARTRAARSALLLFTGYEPEKYILSSLSKINASVAKDFTADVTHVVMQDTHTHGRTMKLMMALAYNGGNKPNFVSAVSELYYFSMILVYLHAFMITTHCNL